MRIVITGTSSGIGRRLTEHLLSQGHHVWGLARSDQADFERRTGDVFHASRCDVAVWEQVEAVAQHVATKWSCIDGLVTCAGVHGAVGPTAEVDPKQWSDTIRANLDGTFYAFRAFHMLLGRTSRRPKIVCLSGGGATKPRVNFSAYGVAKTGVVRLVETIAAELGDAADINALAPGAIATRLTDEVIQLGPEVVGVQEYASAVRQKQAGGEAMASAIGAIEWLLSPGSDRISGRLIAAPWDPWPQLGAHAARLAATDIYTLRRIVPEDRGQPF
jgi:NAD(P)-dependent dehydrogenase (short-subunit alcohol dehydrogenase family)